MNHFTISDEGLSRSRSRYAPVMFDIFKTKKVQCKMHSHKAYGMCRSRRWFHLCLLRIPFRKNSYRTGTRPPLQVERD